MSNTIISVFYFFGRCSSANSWKTKLKGRKTLKYQRPTVKL